MFEIDSQLLIGVSSLLVGFCFFVIANRFPDGWRQTMGLPLAFLSVCILPHVGMFVYLSPWYDPTGNAYLKQTGVTAYTTGIGCVLTAIAVVCFTFGVCLMRRGVSNAGSVLNPPPFRLCNKMMIVGLLFLIASPIIRRIPSATPVGEAAKLFLISGICLGFIAASCSNDKRLQKIYLMCAMGIPVVTLAGFGFVASGVAMVIMVLACFVQPRGTIRQFRLAKVLPIVVICIWIGLCFYVTYMGARQRIRKSVWGDASIADRVGVLVSEFSSFQFFNPVDSKHLHQIDIRLNQNSLIGRTVVYHSNGRGDFENGRTIAYAFVAWIPRLVWPDKPSTGGSLFVTEHTGRRFAKGTTVAAGQIFELYVNFGIPGVMCGFLLLGVAVRWLDLKATECLLNGYHKQLVQYHIFGLCLIQPATMFFFLVTGLAGAFVLVNVVSHLIGRSDSTLFASQAA